MKRNDIEVVEYMNVDNGIVTKTIVQRKWHCGRILWEKTNYWNSRDGYVHKEF